jgi:multidrug transporter EmrE-like cation transporter
MKYIMYLVLAFVLNSGSYIFYKYSSINSEKKQLSIVLLIAGLLVGALNAISYTKSLKGINLNTAYIVFSTGSLILITIISSIIFNEVITLQKLLGIFVLVIGVMLVAL